MRAILTSSIAPSTSDAVEVSATSTTIRTLWPATAAGDAVPAPLDGRALVQPHRT